MTISTEEHTVKRYDQELATLRNLLMEMGGLVEDQIAQVMQALDDEDVQTARAVIARDNRVNELEIRVDEACVALIAMRQPVASDLRTVMSFYKTVTDLERCGDEATKIARMVAHIYDSASNPPSNRLFRDVVNMFRLASRMLHDSLDALARLDADKAIEICRSDKELDQEFQAATRHLLTYMMEDTRIIGHGLSVIFMVKALERIGDHAKNIAEYVVYLVKGTDIRHAYGSHLNTDHFMSDNFSVPSSDVLTASRTSDTSSDPNS